MYVLNTAPRWSWPVRVRVPADGGRFDEQRFDATFTFVHEARVSDLTTADPGGSLLLQEAVVDWSGVVDEQKFPIPFSAGALSAAISISFVRVALLEAYRESITGAARKN